MAERFSQESVLDFLLLHGGQVSNTELTTHFRHFLKEPGRQVPARELFIKFVNSLAVVKDIAGVKHIVLKLRYRELLQGEGAPTASPPREPRRPSRAGRRGSPAGVARQQGSHRGPGASARRRETARPKGRRPDPCQPGAGDIAATAFTERHQGPAAPSARLEHRPVTVPRTHGQQPELKGSLITSPGAGDSTVPLTGGSQAADPGPATCHSWEFPPDSGRGGALTDNAEQPVLQTDGSGQQPCWTRGGGGGGWSLHPQPKLRRPSPTHLPQDGRDPEARSGRPAGLRCSSGGYQDVVAPWPNRPALTPPTASPASPHRPPHLPLVQAPPPEHSVGHLPAPAGCHHQPLRDQVEESVPDAQRLPDHFAAPAHGRKTISDHVPSVPPSQSASSQGRWEPASPASLTQGTNAEGCVVQGQKKSPQRSKASTRSHPLPEDGRFPNRGNKSSKKQEGRLGNEEVRVAKGWSPGTVRPVWDQRESSQSVRADTKPASPAQRRRQTGQEAEPKSEQSSPNSTFGVERHEWTVQTALGRFDDAFGLFNTNPSLAMKKDFISGYTALHWIAKHGNRVALSKFFRMARKRKVPLNVNVKTTCGYTPLHLAAIHGHVTVIQYLVKRSLANTSLRDHSGKKPWQYLSTDAPFDVCQLLGAPRNQPITDSGGNKHQSSRAVSRKTSFTDFFKSPPILRKFSHFHSDHFSALKEEDEEDN